MRSRLHARTREQGYAGQARWEYIAAVKDAIRIPVIGNGDIRSPEDACTMVAETGCDAVMIGRAAPANPWIFRQIAQYTAFGSYDQPTPMDRYRMIRDYFVMLMEETEEPAAISGRMKQFASWFTHGVPGGAILRKSIYEAKSSDAVLAAVDAFFAAQPEQLVADLIRTKPLHFASRDDNLSFGNRYVSFQLKLPPWDLSLPQINGIPQHSTLGLSGPTGTDIEVRGIPHLAKNERDMGHPCSVARTGFKAEPPRLRKMTFGSLRQPSFRAISVQAIAGDRCCSTVSMEGCTRSAGTM